MPEPIVITLIENNEETDTADEFEVDTVTYIRVTRHFIFQPNRYVVACVT